MLCFQIIVGYIVNRNQLSFERLFNIEANYPFFLYAEENDQFLLF